VELTEQASGEELGSYKNLCSLLLCLGRSCHQMFSAVLLSQSSIIIESHQTKPKDKNQTKAPGVVKE